MFKFIVSLTVKVQCPRAILVDLLYDADEIFLCELVIQLLENLLQGVGRYVSVALRETMSKIVNHCLPRRSRDLKYLTTVFKITFFVVNPEGLLQFLFQRFLVLLNEEPGGQLAELAKLEETRSLGWENADSDILHHT